MRIAVRPRPRPIVLATVAVVVAGLLAVSPSTAQAATSRTTLAPGVTLSHVTSGGQSVYLVSTTLSARATLSVATPHNQMGANPLTTLALAKQDKAIAGINGDTFYFDTSPRGKAFNPSLGPHGGVVRNGVTVKAPLVDQNAVFALTRSGHAYIGPVGFAGTLKSSTGGGTHRINSINSIETAWNGNVIMTDSALRAHALRGTCDEVIMKQTSTANHWLVTGFYKHLKTYRPVGSQWRGLVTCDGSYHNPAYFEKDFKAGHSVVTTSFGYARPSIATLISGTSKLVGGGKVFHDNKAHRAVNVYGNIKRAETFVCVSKDRTTVTFGAFEGNSGAHAGVTYAQESAWLIKYQHCWEAMALDGSTSAQVVAKKPHGSLALQYHAAAPYPGGQRPQVDGLFVVTR